MRPDAVVPLMFEAWELDARRVDVDVGALRSRGIRVAGTNERHPAVDVFSYLGPMAVGQLADAAVGARDASVLLLCDNPFLEYLAAGLDAAGAHVTTAGAAGGDVPGDLDAVVVALRPTGADVLGEATVARLAREAPGAVVTQFWGDLDRALLDRHEVPYWPPVAPGAGHMGVLPSALGPEPIVRLQTGGLKVGQVLRTTSAREDPAAMAFVDELRA
jgi:hypothetical protein